MLTSSMTFSVRSSGVSRVRRRFMRGVSMIELMVSLTLGLLILGTLMSLFLGVSRTSRTQNASAQLDDNGRFAMESVARVVRLAGYRNWGGSQASPPGYAGTGDPVVNGSDGDDADLGFSDTLVVRFHGSGNAPGVADGSVTDCMGAPVPEGATVADWRVNTFAVNSNGGTLQLTCDSGAGPVVLANGIDSFQVLYGLDLVGSDRVPDLWTSATQVATRWDQVVAVRVALLVSGNASARGTVADDNVYRLFGGDYAEGSDAGVVVDAAEHDAAFRNRLRKPFVTTIFLRNRTFASEI